MRTGLARTGWLAALGLLTCSQAASAQDEPDMRAIPPFVMIVADTSGSMEYLPDPTCVGCMPDCSLPNDSVTNLPPPNKKNRWATLLEALTGTFMDFQCVALARTDPTHMTYDFDYPKPFHRPWVCPNGDTWCDYPGTDASPIQVQNGLLDNYAGRIRFGLATFDGMRTYKGASDLVAADAFSVAVSEGADGSYSYGGPKIVHYPTCEHDYMIDSGIRSSAAPEGGLISLNSNVCATPPCSPSELSRAIQTALLNARTFGGTPTASALDDLYYHFKNDLNDTMASCRERYAVLITDGYADDDFRDYPNPGCDCVARGNCPADEDPALMHCPYPTAVQAAWDLKHGRTTPTSTDDPQISQLFVVGMSIDDDASRTGLNAIASAGGSIDVDGDGNEAFFADDPSTLTATLDQLLGDLTKPISRSVPAFAIGLSGSQYQISAGFTISAETPPPGFSAPWKGILERRRFICDASGQVTSPNLSDDDRFDQVLNNQSSRLLRTALPGLPTTANVTGQMARGDASQICGLNGCDLAELTSVPSGLFGPSVDSTQRTILLDWMYGNPGSIREDKKLGDIYHSSPTIVGPPVDDPGDQSYSLFRESPLIVERPVVMYINSNDGILHAFSVEDYPHTNLIPTVHAGKTYNAGQELWGFVPPILLDKLNGQLTAHRLNLDGTPVVKDVYFGKGSVPSATDYKTVLITGMRSGGSAYIALDVTDPEEPKFLWQFTDVDMGLTYGQPEIVQARYSWPYGQPATLRAMAILPGGKGERDINGPGCDPTSLSTPSMRVPGGSNALFTTHEEDDISSAAFKHRAEVQCWKQAGRSLYFVDVETGQLIKKISADSSGLIFPSPVVGSPTAYQDSVGTVATEGFVLDADGVLWRIDLTATDQRPNEPLAGWTVRPFHDLFWDMGPSEDETTYERPILSLDEKHQLVIILGTGDTDDFEKPSVRNRIVSLTELKTTPTPSLPSDYVAGLNWELRVGNDSTGDDFVPSELVTGTMALFDSQLYVASFISVSDTTDPCARGLGRLWSLHYKERDPARRNTSYGSGGSGTVYTYGPRRLEVLSTDTSGSNADLGLFNIPKASAEPNLLIQGLGATQRITCDTSAQPLNNYFSSALSPIQQTQQPSIWIVAQASSDNRSRNRAGSQLGTLEVKLNRPLEFSQVSSWAGSIE